MLGFIKNIAFGWKGTLLTAAIAGSVAFAGGWKGHSVLTDARKADDLEAAHAAHIEAMAALQTDLDSANREKIRLSEELQTAEGKTRTITREIIKEVPTHAPVSTPDCDRSLPSGLVELHNYAALGIAPSSSPETNAADELLGGLPRSEYVSDYP